MTVIVCLDNANGMMFNHRRQSRDANVVKDILKTINGASLLIAPYSEPLFSQAEYSVSVSDSFLIDAGAEDYCFVENTSVAEFKEKISQLVIYNGTGITPQISILTLTMQTITSLKLRLTSLVPPTKRSRGRYMSDEPLF